MVCQKRNYGTNKNEDNKQKTSSYLNCLNDFFFYTFGDVIDHEAVVGRAGAVVVSQRCLISQL